MKHSNPDQIIIDETLHEEPQHPQFAPGEKVRDIFGKVHTVAEQIGCSVYVVGQNGWFHPSKIHPVG